MKDNTEKFYDKVGMLLFLNSLVLAIVMFGSLFFIAYK